MTITIIGLGPGSPEMLTRRAWEVLSNASEIYVRTARHPTLDGLPASVRVKSFDYLYEQAATFSQVYSHVADAVVLLGVSPDVIYPVSGHPLIGYSIVTNLL